MQPLPARSARPSSPTGCLLLGLAPSRRTDGDPPWSGASGRRLAGLLRAPLAAHFALANLLDRWPGADGRGDRFDPAALRAAAARLLRRTDRPIIATGRPVAVALGLGGGFPPLRWGVLDDGRPAAYLPHPSGLTLWYNDLDNRCAAAAFLRAAAGLER